MASAEGQEYKLSSSKYMGLLKEPEPNEPPLPSTYWKLSGNNYSDLTEKLRLQKMNR